MSLYTTAPAARRAGPWFSVAAGPADAPLVLVLPFAGGGRSFYPAWEPYFAPWGRLCFVNLPGRDLRFREEAHSDLAELLPPLTDACADLVSEQPYLVFGHSMGALLGYELSCAMRDRGLPQPLHLVVSGLCSPDTPLPGKALADVDDADMLAELVQIMGLSPGEHSGPLGQLISAMLPTARADFTLCERYRWRGQPPLDHGITALWSSDDPLTTPAGVAAWERHTTGGFRSHRFGGPHFFIREHGAEVASILSSRLLDVPRKERNSDC